MFGYNIEVMRESDSRLVRWVWRFWITTGFGGPGIRIVLDRFVEQERDTTRHKYRDKFVYARTDSRYNTMTLADVPADALLGETVRGEVIRRVTEEMDVVQVDPRGVVAPWGTKEGK